MDMVLKIHFKHLLSTLYFVLSTFHPYFRCIFGAKFKLYETASSIKQQSSKKIFTNH